MIERAEQPNYYSIIPATVRYDNDLKANEKLLYGEISSLCNKSGYCYATNEYFAKLYGVHKNTISAWISNLQKKHFVESKILYKKDSKTIEKRILFLGHGTLSEIAKNYCEIHQEPISEISDRYQSNHLDPINEITKENNTSINIYTNNNIEKNIFEFIEENFGRTLSSIEYEEINTWKDNELTRYAIRQAVLNGKYAIKYISKILYEYEKGNIQTVQQAQQREKEFLSKRNIRKPISTYQRKETEQERYERQLREAEEYDKQHGDLNYE